MLAENRLQADEKGDRRSRYDHADDRHESLGLSRLNRATPPGGAGFVAQGADRDLRQKLHAACR